MLGCMHLSGWLVMDFVGGAEPTLVVVITIARKNSETRKDIGKLYEWFIARYKGDDVIYFEGARWLATYHLLHVVLDHPPV